MAEPQNVSFWDKVKNVAMDVRDKTEELAIASKIALDKKLEEAKKSEAWANTKQKSAEVWEKTKEGSAKAWEGTKEGSAKAWAGTQTLAMHAREGASAGIESLSGKVSTVTFMEQKLGMTLAREVGGKERPVVSRVDAEGAAAKMGVSAGDIVLSMRPGFPSDGTDEPTIKVDSYDHLMGLFPAMGRPVTITFLTPRKDGIPTGGVVGTTMEEELAKAARIVALLTSERALNPDALVPQEILRRARGLAFIRVAKLGLWLSVKVGTGIVVTRLGDALDSWSAPCAIGTAGMGVGLQIGAELTDFMIVLNTAEAVEAFASGNQVSLGGNVGIAVGPVGRNAGVSGNIHGGQLASGGDGRPPMAIAPCYAYSHSKGLFAGISLEGAVIKPRNDVNCKFYGGPLSAKEILSGRTPPPPAADALYEALSAGLTDDFAGVPASPAAPVVTAAPSAANPFVDGSGGQYAQRFAGEHGDVDSDAAEPDEATNVDI